MQDPNVLSEAKDLNWGPICNWSHDELIVDIEKGIDKVKEFHNQLPIVSRYKLELRTTKWIMTWSGLAIDPDTLKGLLQIELYHYQNPEGLADHLDSRPNLIIASNSLFFKGFYISLKNMWDNGDPIIL